MEDKIEVGEYVRTNKGVIGKLISEILSYPEPSEWILKANNNKIVIVECNDYPVKHSKQLIDLIEVGDFVNGMEVLDIHIPRDIWEPIEIRVDSRYTNFILAEDIETILTKEQFEANCYKVGGEE